MVYDFCFYQDALEPNRSFELTDDDLHRQFYLAFNTAAINGMDVHMDHGVYVRGATTVKAGAFGAWVWRCEVTPRDAAPSPATGEGVTSSLRLRKPIQTIDLAPGSEWLLRLDATTMYPKLRVPRHIHEGPGIRCMRSGEIHIESVETTETYRANDPWYETGPDDPVVASSGPELPASFVRFMVLPTEYLGVRSIKFLDEQPPSNFRNRVGPKFHNDTIVQF